MPPKSATLDQTLDFAKLLPAGTFFSTLSLFIVQGENKPTWNSEGNLGCKKGLCKKGLSISFWCHGNSASSFRFNKVNLTDFILHKSSLEFAFFS